MSMTRAAACELSLAAGTLAAEVLGGAAKLPLGRRGTAPGSVGISDGCDGDHPEGSELCGVIIVAVPAIGLVVSQLAAGTERGGGVTVVAQLVAAASMDQSAIGCAGAEAAAAAGAPMPTPVVRRRGVADGEVADGEVAGRDVTGCEVAGCDAAATGTLGIGRGIGVMDEISELAC